jgi:hypothetical protein
MSMNRPNFRVGKWLHFPDNVDSVSLFPSTGCEMIEVTDNASVYLYFEHSGDNAPHNVELQTTATKSDEVAAIMAEYIWGSNTSRVNKHKFVAGEGRLTDVSAIVTTVSP